MATKGKSTSKSTPAKKPAKPAKSAKPAAKPAKSAKTAKPPAKAVSKPAPTKAPAPSKAVKEDKNPKKEEKKPVKATTSTTASLVSGVVPPDYDPVKDKGEFMSPIMREFFRQKLIAWREELLRESSETIHNTLQGTELQKPDMADRASAETDHALELRTRDRERKLISKINEALLRIEDNTYGYCEETGEPITVARLVARPTATLSIEAQERHERMEKTHRDD